MLLRLAILAAVLAVMATTYFVWRRPPRRLARADLASLGVLEPAVVLFRTRYCAPCKSAAPHLRRAAAETEVPYVQIDVGERPEVARDLGIRTVPTIAVTGRSGRVLSVWTELPPDGQLADALRRARAAGVTSG